MHLLLAQVSQRNAKGKVSRRGFVEAKHNLEQANLQNNFNQVRPLLIVRASRKHATPMVLHGSRASLRVVAQR